MSKKGKSKQEILSKLGITALNEMQQKAEDAINQSDDIVLISPTGTGKTLAFLLPLIDLLDPESSEIQLLILTPSRELAIQIEQVIREMGSGYKVNAAYGGRSGSKDRYELKHVPAILVGTPGRIADHIRRESISTAEIKYLVLDEFDKSLEVGFENEMQEIVQSLSALEKKVLTSATQKGNIPEFVGMENPKKLVFLKKEGSTLEMKLLVSETKDKLDSLGDLLGYLGDKNGILFCNFKDTIQVVSDFLFRKGVGHECFYGGLEQTDRERALIKFRNGTSRLLVATDLAARGIDVPELDFIIHFELPTRPEEFTHRNGRTARMNQNGTAFVLKNKQEKLPGFIEIDKTLEVEPTNNHVPTGVCTLFVSGGRKDKISKGDLAGLFFKQGGLKRDELGVIELKQDCAFVSVPEKESERLIEELNNSRLKKKKVRISLLR